MNMRSAEKSRLNSINLKRQVPKDRQVAGASLHPQEEPESTTSSHRQEFVFICLILSSQSHYAIVIS
jgi:hypothetical protein